MAEIVADLLVTLYRRIPFVVSGGVAKRGSEPGMRGEAAITADDLVGGDDRLWIVQRGIWCDRIGRMA